MPGHPELSMVHIPGNTLVPARAPESGSKDQRRVWPSLAQPSRWRYSNRQQPKGRKISVPLEWWARVRASREPSWPLTVPQGAQETWEMGVMCQVHPRTRCRPHAPQTGESWGVQGGSECAHSASHSPSTPRHQTWPSSWLGFSPCPRISPWPASATPCVLNPTRALARLASPL